MGLGELPGDPTHFANISENCKSINPNLGDLDGTRIPAKLVERAKGENANIILFCYHFYESLYCSYLGMHGLQLLLYTLLMDDSHF